MVQFAFYMPFSTEPAAEEAGVEVESTMSAKSLSLDALVDQASSSHDSDGSDEARDEKAELMAEWKRLVVVNKDTATVAGADEEMREGIIYDDNKKEDLFTTVDEEQTKKTGDEKKEIDHNEMTNVVGLDMDEIMNQEEHIDDLFSEDPPSSSIEADAFGHIEPTLSNDSVKSSSSMNSNASEISNKLEAIMLDRIAAIDQIRNLLETELENDNDLIAEFTGKVSALEQDVMSKDDCIIALNQHMAELKIKNGDYSRELSSLSRTIDELVESNLNKTEMMVALEKDVAAKKNEIVQVNDADQAKQLIIATKTEENATLTQELETLNAGNDGLKKSIEELQSRNADYAEEFEHLLSNLKELVDQNSKLEIQVKELIDANEKLSVFESNYISEVQKNERLTLEHQKMSLTVEKLHFQLQEENMATTQIANRQASLERDLKSAKKSHKQETTKLTKEMKTAVEEQQRLANAAEATVASLIKDHKSIVLDLESKVERLSKELQDEKDTVIQIAESNAKVEAKMKSEKKAAAKESKVLANKLEEIESLLAATTVEKDQFQTMYGDMEGLNKELTSKLEESRESNERLVDMESKISVIKAENDSVTQKMCELEREALETKKRLHKSDQTLVVIAKEKDSLEKSLHSLERKKDSIEKSMSIEVQSTRKEMESLEKRLAMSDDAFLALAKEKEALEKKAAELQRNYEAHTSDLDESRSVQARESAAWMESHAILKSSLAEKQNSLAKVLNEKNALAVEKNEAMKALDLVSSDMAELEHQKTELESNLYAKLVESKGKHNEAISSIQSRLNQTERTLEDMKSEKAALERTVDNLRQENQHLSTELNESKSILSRESAEWQEEKIKLVDEKIKLTQRIYEVESTLINVCNQKVTLETQKADIEREISTELLETKGKHNKKIAEIQARLQETERQLASIKTEKETLEQTVQDLQDINHNMSLKNNSSIMTIESAEFDKEKLELINRLMETEQTLVLVASQNEDLEKQFSQEKQTLKSRLTETEKTLVAINSEKEKLEKKTALLERKLRSSSPQTLPPRPAQSDTSAELSRLQMSFLKEKKEMLGRQQGLEKMLLEALSFQDKKERTPPTTALPPMVNSSSTHQHISPSGSSDSERRKSVDP